MSKSTWFSYSTDKVNGDDVISDLATPIPSNLECNFQL